MEITTAEAARILQVSEAEVRRLLRGALLSGRRLGSQWLIDAGDVHRRARLKADRGRAWSDRVALAALLLLAGRREVIALSDSELARLRRTLRASAASDVIRLSRNLVGEQRLRVGASGLAWLRAQADESGVLATTAESAIERFGATLLARGGRDIEELHLLCDEANVERVIARSGARTAGATANVVLHVVRGSLGDALQASDVRATLAALLSGLNEDARVRTQAEAFLAHRLALASTSPASGHA